VGAILCDEMGLGKTLQSIGLILSEMPAPDEPRCTLIVCPVSVIASWKQQFERFVEDGYFNVEIYAGTDRERVLRMAKRNEIDVLLCSYETLACSAYTRYQEYKEEKEQAKQERSNNKGKNKKKVRRDELRAAWDGDDDSSLDFVPSSDEDEDDDDHILPKINDSKAQEREEDSQHLDL
jgi:hypothetical protein